MRFVGQTEVAEFIAESPRHGEPVRAWLTEIRNGHWSSVAALATDYRSLDLSEPPAVVFHLPPGDLRIETIIDFQIGIVLLTAIAPAVARPRAGNIRHDH